MINYEKKEILMSVEDVKLNLSNKEILRDISFTIRNIIRPELNQGQVISLIGRSGIGKTQLFRLLAGLNTPTEGRVITCNTKQQYEVVKEGTVGIVTQQYTLFEHRRIEKNFQLAMRHSNRDLHYYNSLIKDFELESHLKKFPHQLSGGQKQRVSIVQQLLTGNKFILMDEPFSGLDILMIDKVINVINKASSSDDLLTLIIVSHDLTNTLAVSDTAYILAKPDLNKGATIVKEYDLIEMGLSYHPDIREKAEFLELKKEIKTLL